MKTNIVLALALVLSVNVSAQQFDLTKLRTGAGLSYASEINNIGVNLNGSYSITDEWEGALGFTHIFRKDYQSYNILDFDAHYIFHQQNEQLNFYGIGGLGFTFWNVNVPSRTVTENVPYAGEISVEVPGFKDNGSEIGLNLGIGANYKLSEELNLAPELRYTIMDGSYLRIGASIQYSF